MKQKEITVHVIAQTQVNHNEVGQWLTDMGVEYNYDKKHLTELA